MCFCLWQLPSSGQITRFCTSSGNVPKFIYQIWCQHIKALLRFALTSRLLASLPISTGCEGGGVSKNQKWPSSVPHCKTFSHTILWAAIDTQARRRRRRRRKGRNTRGTYTALLSFILCCFGWMFVFILLKGLLKTL